MQQCWTHQQQVIHRLRDFSVQLTKQKIAKKNHHYRCYMIKLENDHNVNQSDLAKLTYFFPLFEYIIDEYHYLISLSTFQSKKHQLLFDQIKASQSPY